MDMPEATALVFQRIGEFNPRNAAKILGYILLKYEPGAPEMLWLANAPTQVLTTLCHDVEQEFGINSKNTDETSSIENVSVRHLEIELVELLRCRRGIPVSISSIPILYHDKYAMPLQVEGHLLEERDKEKFIRKMWKLLGRMEKYIRIVHRPHGRPSIVLAEDVENMRNDGGQYGLESRVYMTFTPQSVFSEQDAHNYFENFGPVQEVKIPRHHKRMYGFVTFVYPETAALVLSKTNAHCIVGSQVTVKPYQHH